MDARRPVPDLGVDTEAIRAPSAVPRLGWLEVGVTRWVGRHPGTLLHGAAYALPRRHAGPAVVTLHDVAWETSPQDFRWPKRQVWRLSARASVRRAGAVLTVSEFSKREIVATYGVDPDDVLVAPNAAGERFRPLSSGALDRDERVLVPAAAEERPSSPLPSEAGGGRPGSGAEGLPSRYVVALGGATRRNLPLAVEAWRRARSGLGDAGATADTELVVVGRERPADEPAVTWLASVDDETWARVLAGAEALLYPTSYEGFGMPAAEACASGVPVVCARVGALPEVLGDAAAWAAALDAGAFAAALAGVLSDRHRHGELAAAALARARAAPTWEDAADVTVDAYERAWHRRGGGRR